MWISAQSPVCRGGTRLGNSVATIIPVKHKLLTKRTRACKSSCSLTERLKSFTLTISWILANLEKILPGIIVRQHLINRKQMGLPKEQCAEWNKGHPRFCCNLVWVKNGGRIPWNVTAYLRDIQDLLSDGKTLYERRFGEPFKRTNYSIWCNSRISFYFL